MKRCILVAVALLSGIIIPCSLQGANPSIAREMAAAYLRMEIAGHVVTQARKLAGDDETLAAEVVSAASAYRGRVSDSIRGRLLEFFPDRNTATKAFGDFVNRFVAVVSSGDVAQLSALSAELEISPVPTNGKGLSAAIMKRDLGKDIAVAGNFLGDLQAWLTLRGKGEVPPLSAWLSRDAGTPDAVAKPKPGKKHKVNSLRDSEAPAGAFAEAKDDGGSALRSFGAMRRERRKKAMEDAKRGMEQVAAERKTADDEANAKKLAAAQAESEAMQSQARRLAAVEQEAVAQEQNSWRTRIKGVVTTAIGAAGGAFAGSIGSRVGDAAANAVLNPRGK